MAEFFNKKEEMLEVQLTEYGKYLLSMGKLDPAYYAFFDDEILYNSEYAGIKGTPAEAQNNIDRRIRHETPNLKIVPTRTGAETRVERFINSVSGALASSNSEPSENAEAFQQQYFIEKVNFSSFPIGTGDLTSDKNASWSVTALKNTISSSKEYIVTNPSSSFADINNGVIKRIPQLDIDINYQTFFQEGDFSEFAISDYLGAAGENIYLSLYEDYLVLEIVEENTVFQKENFDVEAYYVGVTASLNPAFPDDDPAQPTQRSVLKQMSFVKETPGSFPVPKKIGNMETNIGDVEYYFDLYLDDDIPFDIAEAAKISDMGLSRFKLNRDLYVSEPDVEPC